MFPKLAVKNCASSDAAEVIGELRIDEGLSIFTGAKYRLDHTGVMHQHLLIAPSQRQWKWLTDLSVCAQRRGSRCYTCAVQKCPLTCPCWKRCYFCSSSPPSSACITKGHVVVGLFISILESLTWLMWRTMPPTYACVWVLSCVSPGFQASGHGFVLYSEQRAITRSRCLSVELLAAHSLPTPASLQMMTLTLLVLSSDVTSTLAAKSSLRSTHLNRRDSPGCCRDTQREAWRKIRAPDFVIDLWDARTETLTVKLLA